MLNSAESPPDGNDLNELREQEHVVVNELRRRLCEARGAPPREGQWPEIHELEQEYQRLHRQIAGAESTPGEQDGDDFKELRQQEQAVVNELRRRLCEARVSPWGQAHWAEIHELEQEYQRLHREIAEAESTPGEQDGDKLKELRQQEQAVVNELRQKLREARDVPGWQGLWPVIHDLEHEYERIHRQIANMESCNDHG